jgi:hypothetical protein
MTVCSSHSADSTYPVTLRDWFEVPLNGPDAPWTLHMLGFSLEDQTGQVSSPILAFDPDSGCCRSGGGSIYRLIGAPGANAGAECAWTRWKTAASVTAERDVSQAMFDAIFAPATKGWTPSPRGNPHVARAREILRDWSDAQFDAWFNNRSSFLDACRPRDILASKPELVVAAAQDQYDSEQYCG